ncbi:alpha-hydroxy acid oxidase [Thalassobaculum sp. OXR-137]|uniref:alpha-hydroxy acid oxidase n=1 Tax=Thalassobaculum sp. OXR-137 TaxID=3100173 RepID=UPI002AC99124|nr:alpha-hydroxy acid oxidase [Thalassobaculum sp. OXR-137]WPZ34978.1 alpha-hydroxy acid oxidase [Thalassobaculum sp. OXR-137]
MNDATPAAPDLGAIPQADLDRVRDEFHVLHEIVKRARVNLDRNTWDYMRGGTESETTVKRNRLAFDKIGFRPRVLRDMREVDTSGDFLGTKVTLPLVLCPVGSLESFAAHGPVQAMRAASHYGVPLFLSSVGTVPLEDVAKIEGGTKVFCLYKRGDDAWLDDIVARAVDHGYQSFAITVDSAWYSRRERDMANRFVKPWRQVPGMEFQKALNWKDVERFKKTHDIPLILKGIATAEDARMAVEHGAEMVFVSNHGGRQLDHGLGALDALPEVVDAVAGRAKIAVDGGVTRGSDIIKARALGADVVGIGRMLCCGLAAGGAAGVVRVLELLEEEVRIDLGLLGLNSFDDIDGRYISYTTAVEPAHVWSQYPLLAEDDYTY